MVKEVNVEVLAFLERIDQRRILASARYSKEIEWTGLRRRPYVYDVVLGPDSYSFSNAAPPLTMKGWATIRTEEKKKKIFKVFWKLLGGVRRMEILNFYWGPLIRYEN